MKELASNFPEFFRGPGLKVEFGTATGDDFAPAEEVDPKSLGFG